MASTQPTLVAGFYPSDDPRSYRHPSNANPGQPIATLTTVANRWIHGRIRIEKQGIFFVIIPEVYIEEGPLSFDPATGVPVAADGRWLRLYNTRTGVLQRRLVFTILPFVNARLSRGIKEIAALFKARAIVPTLVAEDRVNVPDEVKKWLSVGTAPSIEEGQLAWKGANI